MNVECVAGASLSCMTLNTHNTVTVHYCVCICTACMCGVYVRHVCVACMCGVYAAMQSMAASLTFSVSTVRRL